jgi:hypothetical protein
MHSGWGALLAISSIAGTVEVIDRRRVTITTPGTPGANQPYHFAENSFAKAFRKHVRVWNFLSPGFESVTSTNVSRQRSAKRRLGCGNKFLPLVVLSDRRGPRIRKTAALAALVVLANKQR